MNSQHQFQLLQIIHNATSNYFQYGKRSNMKVRDLHRDIAQQIQEVLPEEFEVMTERNILSCNAHQRKKCDVVICRRSREEDRGGNEIVPNVVAVLPVKFIMSCKNKNSNNYFEALTGECVHMKRANPNLLIFPINIIFDQTPELEGNRIKKFEKNTFENTYSVHQSYQDLFNGCFNYIIDIQTPNTIGNQYTAAKIIGFSTDTPFISWSAIMPFLLDRK